MFTSARSYLSRFSSLILFVLAVFIVGLLLIMTISSASNKSANTSDNSSETSGSDSSLTYDQPEETTAVQGSESSEQTVSGESSEQTVSVESSTSSGTSYTTSNPQTGVVTEVNLDSQDSVSINTTTTDETGRVDAPGVAVDSSSLPNTGPIDIVAGVIALTVVMAGIAYWSRSRQGLTHQLLTDNR